jgi:tripartite-type tricarboxylate transporter receptor subunit TctC
MIVPFAAGGVTSVVGQVVAERMRRSLGQPIIIRVERDVGNSNKKPGLRSRVETIGMRNRMLAGRL